jgi:thymidylate synthase ThyX
MYRLSAIYSCDYGNQNEGAFLEIIGTYQTKLEAEMIAEKFECEEIAPNFLSTQIERV